MVVAVADIAGDVQILAAEIRRGVEEVHEVAAAKDRTDDFSLRDPHAAQRLRAGVFERCQRGAGLVEFLLRVRQQQVVLLVLRLNVQPQHFRVGNVCTAVAAAEALDERGPGGEFGDEQACGDIHPRFDGLGGDHDAVAFAKEQSRVAFAVHRPKARVNEGDALRGVKRLFTRRQRLIYLSGSRHAVHDDKREAARLVAIFEEGSELFRVAAFGRGVKSQGRG